MNISFELQIKHNPWRVRLRLTLSCRRYWLDASLALPYCRLAVTLRNNNGLLQHGNSFEHSRMSVP
jgi:hypothetical protein